MCNSLTPLVRAHADALASGGDDTAVTTGARFIGGFAAACHLEFAD